MRKIWITATVAIVLIMGSVHAEYPTCNKIEVVNITQIDRETLNELMEGNLPCVALEVTKDYHLPLYLFLNGDFVELVNNESPFFIKFKQNIYVRNEGGKFLFGTSTSEWKPIDEFMTGAVSMAIDVDNSEPSLHIGAEINEKR